MHWDKAIAVEAVGGVPFRMYTDRPRRLDALLPFASLWPERAMIIQGDRTVTFDGLLRATAGKAELLRQSGAGPGQRVFLMGWNGPDYVLNYWACLRIGATPVLANAWWSPGEIADAIVLTRPALILADSHAAARLPQDHDCITVPWGCDETGPLDATLDAPAGSIDENDPAAIIFTSGTQGRPKAVELAHRSLLANQMMILHVTGKLPYRPDPGIGDVGLHTGPLFHIGGLHAMHRSVLVGNTLVFGSGRFDAGELLALIERHRIVRWSAVPTMVNRILEHPDLARRDVSCLKAITLGGSAISAELIARVRAGLPSVEARVATGYGLSENGGQATTASGKDTAAKPGATGRAMPLTEVRTVAVPNLPDGEIQIRSPTQMLRYYGVEETPIDAQGWLSTGDLGRVDEDGFIWITGRTKEIIIRGGENIAPAAVEAALATVSGVVESKVFGVPNPEFGEEVMAAVVTADDLTAEALAATLRTRLASFAVPTLWHLQREPLPVNQTGKVDLPALRQRIASAS